MQSQTIVLKKSRTRAVSLFLFSIFMTAITVTSTVRAFRIHDTASAFALAAAAFFAALFGALAWIFALRSLGSIVVDGDLLVEHIGFSEKRQIHLDKVVRITTQLVQELSQVNSSGIILRSSPSKGLVLSAADGATFLLDPTSFPAKQRMMLGPVLSKLAERTDIVQEGSVKESLEVWYGVDPNTHSIIEAPRAVTGLPVQVARRKRKTGYIVVACTFLALFILFGILGAVKQKKCNAIAASHGTVTAEVTGLTMEKNKQTRYDSYTTTDITKAFGLRMSLTYEVDGQQYTKQLTAEYTDNSDVQRLYDEANTGELSVVYPTGHPDQIRPAYEFSPAVADRHLCEL